MQQNNTQHNIQNLTLGKMILSIITLDNECHDYWGSFMLSTVIKFEMLSAIMLNVVKLSVMVTNKLELNSGVLTYKY